MGVLVSRPSHTPPAQSLKSTDRLGQSLIVGIDSTEISQEEQRILLKIRPGGIVLYARNIASYSQVKTLIANLQRISMESSGSPLFIFIDEEPKGAYRLGLYEDVFNSGQPNWDRIDQQTRFAKDLGINVILAPVLDYPLIQKSFIQKRIPPVANQKDFIEFNNGFIKTLQSEHMMSTLKHFPGAGLLHQDTHTAISSYTGRQLLNTSLAIFQHGIDSGAEFVMTTHAIYADIDPKNVATLSKPITRDLLQNTMHFKGLVITDDISDMALVNADTDLAEDGVVALKAGNHMIMYSHYLGKTEQIFDHIKVVAETDQELNRRIEENFDKITATKKLYLIAH